MRGEGGRGVGSPAVMTMNSQIPRLRVLVASLAPFFSCGMHKQTSQSAFSC